MRPSNPNRHLAVAEIKRLVQRHGRVDGTRRARKQYPEVPGPTWHRWANEALAETPFAADKRVAKDLAARVQEHVPVVGIPSLGAVAAEPAAARQAIDWFRVALTVMEDVELLRADALRTGADGKPAVRIPKQLQDSARLRLETIKVSIALSERVYDLHRMQQFYALILEEVGRADPETQCRIVERLAKINSTVGMTSAA